MQSQENLDISNLQIPKDKPCKDILNIISSKNSELPQLNLDEDIEPTESESSDDQIDENLEWIDLKNANNPAECARMANLIFMSAKSEELELSTLKFSQVQHSIDSSMRDLSVSYMSAINNCLKLSSDTLFGGALLLDLFLSKFDVPTDKLKLYTIACYRISAKNDTKRQPTVQKINEMSGLNFTLEEVTRAEVEVLQTVNFKVSYPTSKFFSRRYLEAAEATAEQIDVSNFMLVHLIQKMEFIDYKPSCLALACVFNVCASMGNILGARQASEIAHYENEADILIDCIEKVKVFCANIIKPALVTGTDLQKAIFSKFDLDLDVINLF